MKEYKIFVQRIGLIGIVNILISLSSIILLPILTKHFTIQDYGMWIQVYTTVGLIPQIATMGLPYTMVRFLPAEKKIENIREAFYTISFITIPLIVAISLLMILFSKSIAIYLFDGNISIVLVLSLIVFIASLNNILLNYFRTFQQMKAYSLFLFSQTYINLGLATYFAISGYSIIYVVIGYLISQLVVFLIMYAIIVSRIGFKIPKFHNIREYLSFGLPTIPGNLSYWIVDSSDRYLIGILLGTAFVGYYSPGYTLGTVIMMFLAPFSVLLTPLLSKYYDESNIKDVKILLNYSLKYFLAVAIPAVFGLSILSYSILTILSTSEIASQGYLVTPFVAISTLLLGIYVIVGEILVLEKKTKIVGSIWIIAAILNFVMNLIFIPYLGILSAAAITLAAYMFAFIVTLYYSLKFLKFHFELSFISKSVIASVIMSVFIIQFYPIKLLDIITVVIISTIIYVVVLFLLKGVDNKELKFFKTLLSRSS